MCIAAVVFFVAFVADLLRSSPGDDMAVLGVELVSSAAGTVAGVGAALSQPMTMLLASVAGRQASDLMWAMRLGEDMADAYREAPISLPHQR